MFLRDNGSVAEVDASEMRAPKQERACNGGTQRPYEFANGYGASVVRHSFSHGAREGLWELAVLRDDKLDYSTPITSDVLGWLSVAEVNELLARIETLPAAPAVSQ